MGHAIVIGHCINCMAIIQFNPNHVPSIRVRGTREPLCIGCFQEWNQVHRLSNGLEPIKLHPKAYESEDERNL